jgi:AcrR family transcriptional regulator
MTTVPRQPTLRRTQAERREATRTKLLDAAVDCLTERGYAATSVVDVQQRAGVSRGALQHYWPSRAALMVDAVKALFDSMAARLRAEMAAHATRVTNPNPSRRIQVAIELLWSSFDSSLFRAELELWVAARHDAELRPLVVQHDRRLGSEIAGLCRDMFGPELAAHPRFAEAIDLLTHGMRGAALIVDLHPKRRPQLVPEWHRQTCLTLEVAIAAATD